MFASGTDPAETTAMLNRDLEKIYAWATSWKVSFNPSETKQMIFSHKFFLSNSPRLLFNSVVIYQVYEHKHLGIWLKPTLCWSRHIQHICMKANSKLAVLRSVKYLSRTVLDILYIYSDILYKLYKVCDRLWSHHLHNTLKQSDVTRLNRIQYCSARLVTVALLYTSRIKLDLDLG